ncbi:DUF4388 domain-containing protein [Deinococcus pimensis]|uniref:DUF4388 domain-containing protein n=1 Tax=Deinococcus pimensis TaxID=309888 RepID=UPI00048418EC|nr:DUF4388 domain-containing protein [Deinococcus pimensis]
MMSGSLDDYSIDVLLSVLGRHGGRLTVRSSGVGAREVVCRLRGGRLTDLHVDGHAVTEARAARDLVESLVESLAHHVPHATFDFEAAGDEDAGTLDLPVEQLLPRAHVETR